MQHPYVELRPEYESWVKNCQPRADKVHLIDLVAKRLTEPGALRRLATVMTATGIPIAVQATIGERECGFRFDRNWGQGDPLTRPSVNVPKGRPPLGPPPNDHFPVSWEYAAIDAFTQCNHLNVLSVPAWTLPYACWKWEGYNGFGYRARGLRSPYVVGGTNLQQPGKYVADGKFDPTVMDSQIGCLPVAIRMMEMVPSLSFDQAVQIAAPSIIPDVTPLPIGIGGAGPDGIWQTEEIQRALIKLGYGEMLGPFGADGSYGRKTKAAVRKFQEDHGIKVDGYAGDETFGALDKALKAKV